MDTKQRIEDATRLLEAIVEDRALIADVSHEARERFLIAAGKNVPCCAGGSLFGEGLQWFYA